MSSLLFILWFSSMFVLIKAFFLYWIQNTDMWNTYKALLYLESRNVHYVLDVQPTLVEYIKKNLLIDYRET